MKPFTFSDLERKVGAYLRDLCKSASGQTEHMDVEKVVIISNIIEDTDVHFS